MQVAEAMHKYGQKLKVSTIPIYGGHSFGQQARMLERGVDIIVATPGRAVDHITRKTLDLSSIRILVLDEADEMLDMGFAEDLETILSQTPTERQTVFFSATLPPRIAGMVKRHQRDPLRIEIAKEKMRQGRVAEGAADGVPHPAGAEARNARPRARPGEPGVGARVLPDAQRTSTRSPSASAPTATAPSAARRDHAGPADARHQAAARRRDRPRRRDRRGRAGLDIENLELVVNYDVPTSPDSYVHRIGRVGRAGREGIAITLADPRESRLLRLFEQQTKSKIEIAQVPTIADLRARRLELTRAALHEAILAGGLDHYRVAVESLAQEHDLMTRRAGGGEARPPGVGRRPRRRRRTRGPSRCPRRAATRRETRRGGDATRRPAAPTGRTARIYVGAGRTRRHPAEEPRRRDHRRIRHHRQPDRRHRNRRPLLDRRTRRRRRRRRPPRPCAPP